MSPPKDNRSSASPQNDPQDDLEPLVDSNNISSIGISGVNSDAQTTTHSTPATISVSKRLSKDDESRGRLSRSSGSDLELDEMHHEDPIYSNGAPDLRRRSSWSSAKETGWAEPPPEERRLEQMFDREREARRLGNKHFWRKLMINALLIALWYMLSIAMSVYNKWMFSPGNLDFHYPLFSTSIHMVIQFFLASIVLWFFPRLRPSRGETTDEHGDPEETPSRPREPENPHKPLMTPWFYLTRIVSCGSVTGLDIGLGNTSLRFISLTFFTMVKSSTLGFVLAFAIIFRLEAPSWKIGAIIAVMTIGVILMVSGETAFDAIGFLLLLSASFFAGLRWSLTQILLRRTPATSNPFSTLFFLTPIMFLVLFLLAIPVETFPEISKGLDRLAQQKGLAFGLAIVLFPGCIAFCMTAAEFSLLKRTSVVTLSVCGIFKEVLTITAAGLIFGDELTPINISGLAITLAAIAVYNYTRMTRMKKREISKARDEDDDPSKARHPGASTGAAADTAMGAAAEPTAEIPLEHASLLRSDPATADASTAHTGGRQSDDTFKIDDDDDDDVPMLRSGKAARESADELDDSLTEPPASASKARRRDGYEAL